jgi:hypothetical protein
MEIDLLYVPGCPNRDAARNLLEVALARVQRTGTIREHVVHSPEEARRLGMRGSPTILIDGTDRFTDPSQPAGIACRLYRSEAGVAGVPTFRQIVEALGE